jgi:hypothetical protein
LQADASKFAIYLCGLRKISQDENILDSSFWIDIDHIAPQMLQTYLRDKQEVLVAPKNIKQLLKERKEKTQNERV